MLAFFGIISVFTYCAYKLFGTRLQIADLTLLDPHYRLVIYRIDDEGIMNSLVCDECGTSFNCGAAPGKERCWCMSLPNLRNSFDLAGGCVCPDCLTLGKAKDITKMRKVKKRQRANSSLRIKT